jgi:hypothetical protein
VEQLGVTGDQVKSVIGLDTVAAESVLVEGGTTVMLLSAVILGYHC